ncbi:hypothetical protein GCM10023195_20420 [Actinoallomurus liliacearum]|uniref:DUF1266 domain-containing protein n=1 Tax=Actinoallomurus liliacearum TaxID=1080073 RepID=A0ABP8TG27_9ACTN
MLRGPKVEEKYPVPLTMHQLWIVSLCAPVNRGSDASRTTLYPFKRINDKRAWRWLAENWEVSSQGDVLTALSGLAQTGYRAQVAERFGVSPLAWDVALYVDVARNAFAAGHLDEAEAWRLLGNVVQPTAATYGSWKEYADDYLLGRMVWMGTLRGTPDEGFPAPQKVSDEHLRALLEAPDSPWNTVAWRAIGEPDQPRG